MAVSLAAAADPQALCPWPAMAATRAKARAKLRALLGEEANDKAWPGRAYQADPATSEQDELDVELDRLGSVTAARIEAYAPAAPAPVKVEAMIRAIAWLRDTRGADRFGGVAGLDVALAPVHSGPWFRQSGAMSLLSPWRPRGAGECA